MALQVPSTPARRTRVVVVGAGFAGFTALRRLERTLRRNHRTDDVELVLVTPHDYMLYTPLLPEVATGVLAARNVAVSLRQALPRTRVVPGWATRVDVAARTLTVDGGDADGHVAAEQWDELVLVPARSPASSTSRGSPTSRTA